MLVALILTSTMLLGLFLIATLKGSKATSMFHLAIIVLAFGNLALYNSSNYPYAIYFSLSMICLIIYEITQMSKSRLL